MVRAGNENLLDHRFYGQGGRPDIKCIDRNTPVGKYFKAKFFCGPVENVTAFFPQLYLFWKENNAYGVPSKRGQVDAKLYAFVKKEFVWDLDEYSGSISCVAFTTAGSPVLHIFKDG